MSWIADVIYGLKLENGSVASLNRDAIAFDTITGQQTRGTQSYTVQNMILLPLSTRQAFWKAVFSGMKAAYADVGDTQFIIDIEDLPVRFVPKDGDYVLDSAGKRYDVNSVENINGEAFVLMTKSV